MDAYVALGSSLCVQNHPRVRRLRGVTLRGCFGFSGHLGPSSPSQVGIRGALAVAGPLARTDSTTRLRLRASSLFLLGGEVRAEHLWGERLNSTVLFFPVTLDYLGLLYE